MADDDALNDNVSDSDDDTLSDDYNYDDVESDDDDTLTIVP